MDWDIPTAMDEFHSIFGSAPVTEAPDRMIRLAATMPADVSITALARLYVVSSAHARHAEAQLAAVQAPER